MKHDTDRDYFINKVKGALMYKGGDFENKDLTEMNAYDLIDSCFRNGIELDCKIVEAKSVRDVIVGR